jgi:hypothetical protein
LNDPPAPEGESAVEEAVVSTQYLVIPPCFTPQPSALEPNHDPDSNPVQPMDLRFSWPLPDQVCEGNESRIADDADSPTDATSVELDEILELIAGDILDEWK